MSKLMIEHLCFAHTDRLVLCDLSLTHEIGSILTLLGPSGSGKTTLLWLAAGLLEPARGKVRFEMSQALPPKIGFVFQDGALWEHLTVRQHLEVVTASSGEHRNVRSARIGRVLDEIGLTSLAHRRPSTLSGGERQRLSLARALVIDPDWLLLDEPTSQLDGPSRDELAELLATQVSRTRAGVLIATHQVDLAMRLSDRIALMLHGAIAQIGSPREVYQNPVNLAAARLLGPAAEWRGVVLNGVLFEGAHAIMDALSDAGERTIIFRPEGVWFDLDDAGPISVERCFFTGGYWAVCVVTPGGQRANVACASQYPPNARGRLRRRIGYVQAEDGS